MAANVAYLANVTETPGDISWDTPPWVEPFTGSMIPLGKLSCKPKL